MGTRRRDRLIANGASRQSNIVISLKWGLILGVRSSLSDLQASFNRLHMVPLPKLLKARGLSLINVLRGVRLALSFMLVDDQEQSHFLCSTFR